MTGPTGAPPHREIERKFLVSSEAWRSQVSGDPIAMRAGYLSRRPEATIRIRFEGAHAVLTIKGKATDTEGRDRQEHNFAIPAGEAELMLAGPMLDGGVIEKIRYPIRVGASDFTVDVFTHPRPGLVLAEIELEEADADFERPDWLGAEVTSDWTYANSTIAAEA